MDIQYIFFEYLTYYLVILFLLIWSFAFIFILVSQFEFVFLKPNPDFFPPKSPNIFKNAADKLARNPRFKYLKYIPRIIKYYALSGFILLSILYSLTLFDTSSNIVELKYPLSLDGDSSQFFVTAAEFDTSKYILPTIVESVKPDFPERARKAVVSGTVIIKAWINQQGFVGNAIVYRTEADIFNQTAVDAINKWVFIPAKKNNQPITVWVEIPIIFKSNGIVIIPN